MVKRVLILAAFGGYNLGDDAIVDESIKKISKHYDAIDLIGFYDNEKSYFKINELNKIDNYYYLYNKKEENIVYFLKKILDILIRKKYEKMYIVGGGYFNEKYLSSKALITIYLFMKKSKKLVFSGQSVGRFSKKIDDRIVKKIYLEADNIGVREKMSHQYLSGRGYTSEVVGDDIFLKKIKKINQSKEEYIAVNKKKYPDLDSDNELYQEILIEAFKVLRKDIILIPFNSFTDSKEYICHKKFMETLLNKGISAKIVVPESVDELCEIMGESALNIGNAYHFAAFSILTSSNFLTWYKGEYYEQKIKGMIDLFQIRGCTLELDDFNGSVQKIIKSYNQKVTYGIEDIQNEVIAYWNKILNEY